MTAAQVIEKNVLIDTLLAIEEPVGVFPVQVMFPLPDFPGEYKIFWEHVIDDMELPYIVVSHIMGGRYQGTTVSQSYSDTTWKVVVHTANMKIADTSANLISMLKDRCPVTTRYPGINAYSSIQETMPIFDRYQLQNVPMFMIGGLYRLRLNLGNY